MTALTSWATALTFAELNGAYSARKLNSRNPIKPPSLNIPQSTTTTTPGQLGKSFKTFTVCPALFTMMRHMHHTGFAVTIKPTHHLSTDI